MNFQRQNLPVSNIMSYMEDIKADTNVDDYRKPKLNELNYDVLRNIFDRLNLTDIISVQRACSRFKEDADFRHRSATFELQSFANGRIGNFVNWLKEAESVLQRYAGQIKELDADYNCFEDRNDHKELGKIVLESCKRLKVYTVRGSRCFPTISVSQLIKPKFNQLHTLRLCNFSCSTTDTDVAEYLQKCYRTLRSLRVENMWLTGNFLEKAPVKLKSLELVNVHDIRLHHITTYLDRNRKLKRFEYVIPGLARFMPAIDFFDKFDKLEDLKLHVDNRRNYMLPLSGALLRSFPLLTSMDIDSQKLSDLESMFHWIVHSQMLERLSITLSTPIAYFMLECLGRLRRLNYLKVNFYTKSSAERMDYLWPSVRMVTELEVISHYGCNVSRLCATMPDIEVLKFQFGTQCTGLESIAWLKNLRKFEVRISETDGINILYRLVMELIKARPMKNLTVSRISSKKFEPIRVEDVLESKFIEIPDARNLGGIAYCLSFQMRPVDVLALLHLLGDKYVYKGDEIMLAGDLEEIPRR